MKSIYIPNESFQTKNEVNIINKILYDNMETLYNYVDESIEIWILGNKDQKFLDKLIQTALKQNRIYDPFDELPINQHRDLLHVAVINHNITCLKDITRETIYGNVDYNIHDFVRSLIFRLVSKFPKNVDNNENNINGENIFDKNKSVDHTNNNVPESAHSGTKYPYM